MAPRAKIWVEFSLTVCGMALIVVVAAFLLNFMGDCADMRDCGETQRRISFVVLAFGAIAIAYYVYRFARSQKR
jgi:membrane protein implicated in regulation of membrane protease activity